jgi:hypothetical protein
VTSAITRSLPPQCRQSLEEMLTREAVLDYRHMKTGEKYLVTPQA